jgi:guanylate kinase
MLDGWMIEQRKQQAKNKKIKAFDSKNNGMKNAKEVFLFPKNQEEFSEVMSLNDPEGKMTIKERMSFVQQKGKAEEYELPDVKRDIQMQLRQLNKGK